jgi:hypothetical protein
VGRIQIVKRATLPSLKFFQYKSPGKMRYLSQGYLLTPLLTKYSSQPTKPREQILSWGYFNNVANLLNLVTLFLQKRKTRYKECTELCKGSISPGHLVFGNDSSISLFSWIQFYLNCVLWNLGKITWISHINRTDEIDLGKSCFIEPADVQLQKNQ